MADGFFDDFGEGMPEAEVIFTEEEYESLRQLLSNQQSFEDLERTYRELVCSLLERHGSTVEEARVAFADPYLEAASDRAVLEQLVGEARAAAAAQERVKSEEEWVPPPPDVEPETALDME